MIYRRTDQASVPRWIVRGILLAVFIGMSIALFSVILQLRDARRELGELKVWRGAMLRQLTIAQRDSVDDPALESVAAEDAPEALADLIASRATALDMLSVSKPYPVPGSGLRTKVERGHSPARPESRIGSLMDRRSTGSAGADVEAIEEDSQVPWSGWK